MLTDKNPTGAAGNSASPGVAVCDTTEAGFIRIPPATTAASFSPIFEILSSLKIRIL